MQKLNFSKLAWLALPALTALGSCGEKFLDLQPTDQLTTSNFYKTPSDANQAALACYGQLGRGGQYNYALWGIGEIMSDNSFTGGGGGADGAEEIQLDQFNIPSNNLMTTRLWNGCYVGVGACNIALQKIPGITMDANLQKSYLGEAQFLRAKYYFDLVRAYGDVPLITVPPASPEEARAIGRTPVDQVYTQIITDLTAAASSLPESWGGADLGRATKWAATGLLAKVYLTQGTATSLPLAAAAARSVIASNKFNLWPNYADAFSVNNENGQESLFEVQYKNGLNEYTFDGLGFVGNEFFGPRGAGIVPQGGYGFNIPELNFVQGYEAGDKRKAVTIWSPGDAYPAGSVLTAQPASQTPSSPYGYNCKKWFVGKVNTIVWDSPLNFPVLRYAEMYLILAEAVGQTTEGVDAINKVRTRAGLPNLTLTTPNFKEAVWKERRYELAFEDDRWFDLKRQGQLLNNAHLRSKGIKQFNVLLPIPQTELDANPNLTQNQGY